ncbi:response regulator receiver modulated diguanylate cyclase [Phyllobacterium sp. YR620]|uniref:PleD family two-component system response regulator n=1 Tax=Phyllobacterium TaxID=28100 RepID=UPI000885ADF9|nr:MULTISPECIES: PleD family two-component system response regulator [unclassified Phyllobacterium]UGY08360.1 PleD family two-component system response regulator [Phyllobacterium sp. T1018]SDP60927.1 response regulator receiver modulated diguanylate cyclase [Phyllobacterium sp. YR620]
MTARILVVDDVPANVKLLEARLTAEYYEVVTATDGYAAIDICETSNVDVILLDIMMPGMDGFEVCRRLKSSAATAHIPIVLVTALDGEKDRITGLDLGADDFLTKPVNDLQLLARVKSLVRLKNLTDELRLRVATTRDVGLESILRFPGKDGGNKKARVLLIDERLESAERIQSILGVTAVVDVQIDPQTGFFDAIQGNYDCLVISSNLSDFDPLRICAQLRSLDNTRSLPIILIARPGEETLIRRALELGVNDYVMRPLHPNELLARLRTQLRRKAYHDGLRASVVKTYEMAVTDSLTGLHNRLYLETHLATLFKRAVERRRPLSVLMTDIDRFKLINDTHGHDGGDEVLREFAKRLRRNVRGSDLASRYGGEEFFIVMPDTDTSIAAVVAERIRREVASTPFPVNKNAISVPVTISVGIASVLPTGDSVSALLKRADDALYDAKAAGRNRVVSAAA